jgi:hypothetical protein
MSFQLTFLGYYLIKSPQLKKQTHSVKRRNWSHRERTAQADGGGGQLPVDGNCGRPSADGAAVRLCRTALEDGPGGQPPRRTSVGSSDASGRPADAAVDVRTHDNPGVSAESA